ncbi:hypothetical protein Dimus_032327, partial [Dionaea muscipula]
GERLCDVARAQVSPVDYEVFGEVERLGECLVQQNDGSGVHVGGGVAGSGMDSIEVVNEVPAIIEVGGRCSYGVVSDNTEHVGSGDGLNGGDRLDSNDELNTSNGGAMPLSTSIVD